MFESIKNTFKFNKNTNNFYDIIDAKEFLNFNEIKYKLMFPDNNKQNYEFMFHSIKNILGTE